MRLSLFNLFFIAILAGCSTNRPQELSGKVEGMLDRAEKSASPGGRKVLVKSRSMVEDGEILKGGCWDFINEVYNRAGFPAKKRATVYRTKKSGPFADQKKIQPGDWLYFINHSYKKIDHSGMFVSWVNFENKVALIMSYAGEKRRTPARYQNYDLTNVYSIIRPSVAP